MPQRRLPGDLRQKTLPVLVQTWNVQIWGLFAWLSYYGPPCSSKDLHMDISLLAAISHQITENTGLSILPHEEVECPPQPKPLETGSQVVSLTAYTKKKNFKLYSTLFSGCPPVCQLLMEFTFAFLILPCLHLAQICTIYVYSTTQAVL